MNNHRTFPESAICAYCLNPIVGGYYWVPTPRIGVCAQICPACHKKSIEEAKKKAEASA